MSNLGDALKNALSKGSSRDDDDVKATQIMAAEELVSALNPPYERGPAKGSEVARKFEQLLRVTLRKFESEDD